MPVRATARAAGYSDHTLLSKVLNGHKPVTPWLAAKLDRALDAGGAIAAATESDIADAKGAQSSTYSPSIPAAKDQPGKTRERQPDYLQAEVVSDPVELLRQQMNDVFSRGAMTDAVLDDRERTGRWRRDAPDTGDVIGARRAPRAFYGGHPGA